MKKKNLILNVIIILLVLLISYSVSAYECNPSWCDSGYVSKGVTCEVNGLRYECKRECYRPGHCGNYGGWYACANNYFSIDDNDQGRWFTSDTCYEDSNHCYQYKAEGRLGVTDWDPGWGFEAKSVKLTVKDTWDEVSQCSNTGDIWGLTTDVHELGRGKSGGHSAAIKYQAYSDTYCRGSYDGIEGGMRVLFYVRTAPWIEERTYYETCSGEWECENGDTKCEGNNYYVCKNHNWDNQGKIVGKCGVECKENYDCSSGEICKDYKCVPDPCKYVTCEDKCQNSVRYYDGYCKDGECVYKTETCEFGCKGDFCAEDPCKGVECNDKCENSIWYHDGHCVNGRCVYDSKDTCKYGCQGEPNPMLAIIVGEGMCRDDPCKGVECPDYCINDDKNTLATGGKCVDGKCVYPESGKIPYSEECGYVPILKRWWVYAIGIAVLITIISIVIYFKKKK